MSASSPIVPGAVLAGRFVLERELGQGANGVVWAALAGAQKVPVAVKLLGARASQAAVLRFEREAAAMARLRHPSIARVYEAGALPDGRRFIVMERLEGWDLAAELARSGRLPLSRVALLVHQICGALEHAHAGGVIHRDLKPSNVFWVTAPTPMVKVLDFGIAKLLDDEGLALTATGALVGTPHYMSPEQLVSPRGVDGRADLWSIGVLAYRALTGELPFTGETVGAIALSVHKPFVPPSTRAPLPAGMDAWFERALAPRRESRFSSPAELARTFVEVAARPVPTSVVPPSAPLHVDPSLHASTASPAAFPVAGAPRARRRSVALLVAVLVALAAAAGGAALLLRPRSHRSAAKKPAASTTTPNGAAPERGCSEGANGAADLAACERDCASHVRESCFTLARVLSERTAERDDSRALQLFRALCDENDGRGCGRAAELVARGRGTKRDLAEAVKLDGRGCDLGDGPSCNALGRALSSGAGIARDAVRAAQIHARGCDAGRLEECNSLGLLALLGAGTPKDPARAVALFERGCAAGVQAACSNLAVQLERGRAVPRDHDRAVRLVRGACASGFVPACANVTQFGGVAVGSDEGKRAFEVLDRACADGEPDACQYLGWRYEGGEGVPQSDQKAAELFGFACDGGAQGGCVNLGQMLMGGRGVPFDAARATKLFEAACARGNGAGCENLGGAYEGGRGVAADPKRAADAYLLACEAEMPIGCYNLGVCFTRGTGVAQDHGRAHAYFELGCSLGAPQACTGDAFSHLEGRGVVKDEALAAKKLDEQCAAGNMMSCAWLGHLYALGRGVPKDAAKAKTLYERACSSGDSAACAETSTSR